MKVLVFGATGYLGRHLVANFVRYGHQVAGFARNESGARAVQGMGAVPIEGNLGDVAAIPAMLEGYDAVVMAAQLTFADELEVVTTMLDAMEDSGRCFIFTSGTSLMSIATEGMWDDRTFAEDEPFQPRRQIAPRLETEALVRKAAERGIQAIVIRPPLIWGNGGCQIIAEYYESARKSGAVCYVGKGLNVYSNVHVEDLAELYSLAIEKGVSGALYFAVSGEVSYGVMAKAIADELGVPVRSVSVDEASEIFPRGLARIVLQSCSRQRSPRAKADLGWQPSPDRCDILDDCRNPAYAAAEDRPVASWLSPELLKAKT